MGTIDPAYTGSTKGMRLPYKTDIVQRAAMEAAHQFLSAQKDDAAVHGGGWDARELTRLLVHFWTVGYNTSRLSEIEIENGYPPIGATVLNQDDEPVFWGGVNWWSAKLHDWRIMTVTSWHDVVQSDQSTAVEVDGQ